VQAESGFGRIPAAEYLAQANQENVLIVQIEEAAVVPHIDAIAALPGVDVLFVGPGDLTLSLGIPGRHDDPAVLAILQQVVAACQRHGKVAAIPCAADQVAKFHAMGFRFFNTISDYRCVLNGLNKTQADLQAAGFNLTARNASSTSASPASMAMRDSGPTGCPCPGTSQECAMKSRMTCPRWYCRAYWTARSLNSRW
jgi:hypothetical protein